MPLPECEHLNILWYNRKRGYIAQNEGMRGYLWNEAKDIEGMSKRDAVTKASRAMLNAMQK